MGSDNIKIDPQGMIWDFHGWNHLSQDGGQWRVLESSESG